MSEPQAAVIIPPSGDYVWIAQQVGDSTVWATGLLADHGGSGHEIQVRLQRKGKEVGTVFTTLGPGKVNTRARKVMLALTGAHVALIGPVLFVGLDPDAVRKVTALI